MSKDRKPTPKNDIPVGHRLNKIKNDLKDKSMDHKEKALRYSEHLNWMLDTIGELYQAQLVQGAPGVWDQSEYMHGMCNGMIMGLSFFMEDEHPPYKKSPKKYETDSDEMSKIRLANEIELREHLLASAFRCDGHGPHGYGHLVDPWSEWRKDVLETLEASSIETVESDKARQRMFTWWKEWEENNDG